jgi:aminomethyltransferase
MNVTLSDPKSRVLQLQGPTSPAIIMAASDGAIDEQMGYFHSGFFKIAGQEVYVSRTGWTGEIGYEIYTQGDATDCGRLWDRLLEAGRAHGMIVASLASMEIRRIEAGILDSGTDFDCTMTPYEAGLGGFIDFEKADFIGRDALLRASRGKRLFGLKCPDAAPGFGCAVLDGARKLGRVTAEAWSPFLQAGIGYVRMDVAGDWAGRTLTVETTQGSVHACEIVDLPFYDPEKRIPRGLALGKP